MDIAAGAFPTLAGQTAGACAPATDGGFAAALALIGAGADGAADVNAAATHTSVAPAVPDHVARLAADEAGATTPLSAPADAIAAAAVAAALPQVNAAATATAPRRDAPGSATPTALPGQPHDATVSVAKAVTATDPKADPTATGAFPETPDATAHGQQGRACVVPPSSADIVVAVAAPAAPAATPTSPPAQSPVPAADRVLAATPTQPSRTRGIDQADRAIDDREAAVPVIAAIPPADASLQVEPAPAVTTTAPRHGADPRQGRESPGSAAQTIDVAPDARAMSPGEAAPSPPTATPPEASRAPPPAAPARQVLPAVVAVAIGGAGRITVTLEPGELGRVEISVERTGDAPQVLILAERPETLALLQRDQRELDRALTQAGLQAEGRGVSFGLSGGDAGSGQPQRRRAPADGDGAARGVQSHDAAGSIATAPAPRVARSLLDLAI